MNQGSDNQGSTPVNNRADQRELEELFGHRYARIQTSVHGELGRKARRRLEKQARRRR